MKTSESIKNIVPALLKAQTEMGKAVKGAVNPFFHSEYADLPSVMEVVKDPLNNNGIAILQPVDIDVVRTVLMHVSGEWISSDGTKILNAKPNDPQANGSGISYSKRYDLQSLLFVPTTDDDGEKATEHATTTGQHKTTTTGYTKQPVSAPKIVAGSANPKVDPGNLGASKNQLAWVDRKMTALGYKPTAEDYKKLTWKQASDFIGNKITDVEVATIMGINSQA